MIKSQQDVKNQHQANREKIPKSMEDKAKNAPSGVMQDVKKEPIDKRITDIESYLAKVDLAFEKIASEINNLKGLVKIIQEMDSEISKLTGDVIRLTTLQENRYIEFATAINTTNEKLTTLDEYIPIFVDKQINDFLSDLELATVDSYPPQKPDE